MQAALGRGNGMGNLAGGIIDATVNHQLFILSWNGDLWSCPYRSPSAGQRWVAVNLHFILKNQRCGGVLAQGFFFRCVNSTLARPNAFLSRLPFMVCLGRCTENPCWCISRRN